MLLVPLLSTIIPLAVFSIPSPYTHTHTHVHALTRHSNILDFRIQAVQLKLALPDGCHESHEVNTSSQGYESVKECLASETNTEAEDEQSTCYYEYEEAYGVVQGVQSRRLCVHILAGCQGHESDEEALTANK